MMKKLVLAAVLAAILLPQTSGASGARAASACYSQAAIEAEQAIRFVTDLMVVSTACQNTVYGMFRLRNKDAIITYQKAMISHFHGNTAFDTWNTSLANEASRKQAGMTTAQICQQAAELLKQAEALDLKGFRALAAARAVSVAAQYAKCGK
jgi:hypothetical protein